MRETKGHYVAELFLRFVVKHADSHPSTKNGVVRVVSCHVSENIVNAWCRDGVTRLLRNRESAPKSYARASFGAEVVEFDTLNAVIGA